MSLFSPITFIIFLEASTLKLCFQNSNNKKAYTCVRLAMMVGVLIEMAMVSSELAISEKEKKWFKLVRGKLIKLVLPAKSSHCRAWSLLPSRELNFPRTRTSSQTRRRHIKVLENDDEKDVTGVDKGDNYVKRKNLPATSRSSW